MPARILAALALVVLLVSALAGCAAFEPADCRKADLVTYADEMENQIAAYQQQVGLVEVAPRVGIATPLQRLLDLQNETRAVEAPGCLADYHGRVVEAMEFHQAVFQDFAAQRAPDALTASGLVGAKASLDELADQLETIRAGTVPATPTPIPPTPTPEAISPPERGIVGKTELLLFTPAADSRGVFEVCEGDFFEVFARSGEYVQVRITALGNGVRCSGVLPHVAVGLEGWLRDDAVFAP